MATQIPAAYDPVLIRFIGDAGQKFNGQPPETGPVRSLNNGVSTYQKVLNCGYFKFSDRRIYFLSRFLLSAGDATDWSLYVEHKIGEVPSFRTLITDRTEQGGSNLVRLDLAMSLAPLDALVLTTVGNTTAVVAEALGYVQSNVIGYRL